MLNKFQDHINQNLQFVAGGKLLIACSGGLDSAVLVALFDSLALEFSIAHCNFNLRGEESDWDEKFVSNVANKVNAPFFIKHFDTNKYAKDHKLSTQMAARELRYDWFKELVVEYQFDYILTAHHADDNLETFLINLSRGTGIDGLTGIPEVNDMFIRPLLPFSREEILSFAKQNSVDWREDSSNASTKYLRNKLRHEVIPALKDTAPQFLQNFENTLEYLKQSKTFIKSQVFQLQEELFEFSESDIIRISIHRLRQYGYPKAYLYFLLKDYGFTAWNDITQILTAQSGKQIFSESHRLVKDRDYILLSPIAEEITDRYYKIPEEESMLMIPSGTLKFRMVDEITDIDLKTIYVDKEKLKYPLIVRKWEEGDYFYPLGMKGKKKLSKYFKDEKLSLFAKERVWLLCSGKEILWIINYRADNRFKIVPQTKQILKITIT
ncbi:tRNA lysidine(34) synthetase TilS [Aquimarina sp. 2201CG5-10]|uniref:tRNA lysidine(34) synthetase TilS n=1 Tax=Aquimarina callyspongiae TaxID=3098150 RepID=UPI002AB3EED6|nr:tRNA lysidine(34) synthetase TilS [Aquimarina sp. 2201CG5-10]MDY8138201.1 tRNA lysidine(34) synthetase TilS [Aquimarina sp. 2201CG5-10]